MEFKLDCTKGMWLFLKPALACWATLNEYTLPSDSTVINNMQLFYSDEFKDPNTRGDFLGSKLRIRIRPGIVNEVQTWAHEFAHMIQAFSLGDAYRKIYDQQQETVGYRNNLLELQAYDAGRIALLLYRNGVIEWLDTCETPGPSSHLSKAAKQESLLGDDWRWEWCEYYEADSTVRLKFRQYQKDCYNTIIKERRKVYDNIRAYSWFTCAGTSFARISLCN